MWSSQTTDDSVLRRMHIAWWLTKAANTYSDYVILTAFSGQHWLIERALMLRLHEHEASKSTTSSVKRYLILCRQAATDEISDLGIFLKS